MGVTNDEETGYGGREDEGPGGSTAEEAAHLYPSEDEQDNNPRLPRLNQDVNTYKDWAWNPPFLHRIVRKVIKWGEGPQPPRIQSIKPVFATIQEAPIRLLDRFVPKRKYRIVLLLAFYFCWISTFGIVLWESTFASEIEGYGAPNQLYCGSTRFDSGNRCGMNGNGCRPFADDSFAFRCFANCIDYKLLNTRPVGDQEIIYRTLVVGGPPKDDPDGDPIYRGDSFICPAAVHAGVIDNVSGGCGVVSYVGESRNYNSTIRNGITSIAFDSYFPTSFTFKRGVSCEAKDLRWPLLGISLTYSIIFSLFTTSPALFFFTTFTSLFFHVGFASDPPRGPPLADLFSNLLEKYLPAMFCMFVMYKYFAIRTLRDLTAQIEKTVLWLGGAWIGALSNYTFNFIPIQRLTAHDLKQQPGAILYLIIIVIIIALIVAQQVYYFRLEGRLPRYLSLYITFIVGILLSLAIPGLELRIHHYILGLLFFPGTSMQTRPVLLYQGLLVGLFVNGIARWGFASIMQTPGALQGDGQNYNGLPDLFEPVISLGLAVSRISFAWAIPKNPFDGVSVLVNDVERFRGFNDEGYGGESGRNFTWERKADLAEPEYFRFGYMSGPNTWDYTKAGTWLPDGSWIEMQPGPAKLKRRVVDTLQHDEF